MSQLPTHGIPTTFKARRYRSRLEAKWAAFFNLLGWSAEYEPLDCDGWIPDFAIKTFAGFVLVEVKPITLPSPEIYEKIDRANTDQHEVLIVGLSPFPDLTYFRDSTAIGWISEPHGAGWSECILGENWAALFGGRTRRFDFFSSLGSWRYRISGDGGDDDSHLCTVPSIEDLWSQACNSVQWRRK